MAATYRWVYTPEYNRVKKKQKEAKARRLEADRKLAEAEERLRRVKEDLRSCDGRGRGPQVDFSRLEEEFSELELALRAEIGAQNLRFRAEIDAIRAEMDGVTQDLTAVQRRLEEAEQSFNRQFLELTRAQEAREDRARLCLGQLRTNIAAVRELHPDKLAPGELSILEAAEADVLRDLRNGDHEAAIGVAQTRIPEAVSLEARLAVLNERYEQLVLHIHEAIGEVEERIVQVQDPRQMKDPSRTEEEDPSAGFDGRVGFWSGGLLEEVLADYEALLTRITERYEPDMDLEALEDALTSVREMRGRLDRCVTCARREAEEAGHVERLAQLLYEALVEDGVWNLVTSGYAGGDERQPVDLTLVNGNGDLACFVLVPRRRELGRTRTGIRYGDTEFVLRVFDETKEEEAPRGTGTGPQAGQVNDETCCEVVRNAVLARLNGSGVTTVVPGKAGAGGDRIAAGFFAAQNAYGNGIRDSRISEERRRLGLTG